MSHSTKDDPASAAQPEVENAAELSFAGVDWSATGCGPPDAWSASLRNAVGLIRRSGFPMFLVWGGDRTLLYNDAYIPILGERHPSAFGRPFFEIWPEVREIIEPIVNAAFAGSESFFEDLEITLERQGRPERAWFTFSYSPVIDETGAIPGILCVCVETTAGVLAREAAKDEQRRQQQLFAQAPEFICILSGPEHVFEFVNEAHKRLFGSHDWVGKPIREAFPEIAGQGFIRLLDRVLRTGERYVATAAPAVFKVAGGAEEQRFHDFIYEPLRNDAGEVIGVFCSGYDVTEAHRAQQQLLESQARLRESEEQLRLATEAAEIGLWDVDVASDSLYWPARVKAMFGIHDDRPVSMQEDFYPCLHPEDRDRVARAFAAAADPSRRATYDVEYRTIGKDDGIVRWVAAKGRGLFDGQGRCHRVIGAAVDITARKQAERAAQEQAHSLEVLNETGAALAAELDLQKILQLVTDAGVKITGAEFGAFFYNFTDAAGESYTLYTLSGVDRSAFDRFPMPRNTAVFGPTFRGEGVLRSDDITADPRYGRNAPHRGMPEGHLPVRSYLAVPVRSRSGEVLGGLFFGHSETGRFTTTAENLVLGVAGQAAVAIDNAELYREAEREIERRRAAEAELRALNDGLEAAVRVQTAERNRVWEMSRDLLAIMGFDGRLKAINPAWSTTFGMDADTLLSLSFREQVHPGDHARVEAMMERLLQGETVERFEDRIRHADGSWRWISWTLVPEGGVFYAVGRDVTQEKKAAAELERAQEALRQSQKMEAMGQLTGGVAHDFNNLLMPIIGSLDMLQRKGGTDARSQRMIDGALQSAERAKTLVQRLLAFARRQPLQPRAVDVGSLIHGMEDLLASTVGPRIGIELDVTPGLPPATADANQLEMALLNLAVNARDAMPDGGTLTVALAADNLERDHGPGLPAGPYLRLCVHDTGVGMDEATRQKATEPFFSTKGIGRGTGLGLSMVHGLAAQLGGALTIESAPGEGTTIKIWLPLAAESSVALLQPTDPAAGPGSGTVLLVDDEVLVRSSAREMLADLGYRVIEAESGAEALRHLDEEVSVDLLLTDHLMPGMTGPELAAAARLRRPGLPVLLISGYADVQGVGIEFERLSKPFRQAELAASVANLLRAPDGSA
jgi:PAS domain S-box-containing protein